MEEPIIQVKGISKKYVIRHENAPYKTFQETIINAAKAPFNLIKNNGRLPKKETFWALKGITFDVNRGEVIGIIGRNGTGKTTLLKILSRITEPTEGKITLRGRVASLLEVGTGFHPELTGRENIYLNGSVLGMTKKEIDSKFDEIVKFAEVEKFLDTPVKRYSSGMYVRLAFSVAAHLEPEILLVDEVLAVGDAAFQKKCLGKMGEVAKGGRTVLFVSHQMNSIRKLCERCIWLDAGRIQMVDSTLKVVSAYEAALTSMSLDDAIRAGDTHVPARFLRWEIMEPRAKQPNMLTNLGPVTFKIVVQVNKPIQNGHHGIALWNNDNQLMWGWAVFNLKLEPGIHEFFYTLPTLPLRPGVYYWHVSLYSEENLIDIWHCVPELIIATNPLTHPRDEWAGVLNIPCDFQLRGVKSDEDNLGI